MLNIADIKFNRTAGTEPPIHGAKNGADFPAAANFFTVLQNQLGVTEQAIAQPIAQPVEKIETAKIATSASPEKEKTRDAGDDKGTQVKAAGRNDDQAKPAAASSPRDHKPENDVKAALGEKKSASDSPAKKVSEKIPAEETVRGKNRIKKGDTRDGGSIMDGMQRIIDIFHKIQSTHDSQPVRHAVNEIKDAADRARHDTDRGRARTALEKALVLMEKMSRRALPAETQQQIAGASLSIKDLLGKLKTGQEKNQQSRRQETTDGAAPARTETTLRQDLAVEGMKGNGTGARTGNDGGGDMFGFNFNRGGDAARKTDTAPASAVNNGRFRESLENIVQNARVVVQDGRNGSFSVRLYPKELGSVNVNLGLKDGIIHGRFLVETQEAKDLLMGNIESIKERLAGAGIQVGEFQVNVRDQREGFLRDMGDRPQHFFAPSAGADTVEVEYGPNSRPIHDGLINLMI